MANGYISQGDPIGFWSDRGKVDEDFQIDMKYLNLIGYYARKRFYALGIQEQNEILRQNRIRVKG